MPARLRARVPAWLLGLAAGVAAANEPPAAPPAAPVANGLPTELRSALAKAQVPVEALGLMVVEVGATQPLLSWQAQRPMNPASLFKLATTYAALDLLGPAFAWRTPVWLKGSLREGVLEGDLVIKGQGDPKLVGERLWLLLQRLQQTGLREIRGDIVLDRSAFSAGPGSAADFDGEALRPYNVKPDALLLAYRSVVYTFTPDTAAGVARVSAEPPLLGLQVEASVPLSNGPCEDWRAALKATPADPDRMRFAGSYAGSCGERHWPLAYADPASFDARLLRGLWQGLGGRLAGQVREGSAPGTPPSFELVSPALAEVVRDINKYSNNPMAQQLFLTLALQQRGQGSPEAARATLRDWLQRQLGPVAEGAVVDNGSGLSRENRLSAEQLAGLLQSAWRSPVMPELLASLPVAGLDGTARRARGGAGRAHLKTGSLRDVAAVAGYVLGPAGRRRIVVAMLNHPRAEAARPALDALVQWAATQPPASGRRAGTDNP